MKEAIGSRLKEKINIDLLDNNSSIDFEKEVGTVGFGVISIAAGLIGAWSIVCLAAGVIASHGPVSFIASWFRAVLGN